VPFVWFQFGAQCAVTRLAPGESRTLTLTADAPDAVLVGISVQSEGPDLMLDDNQVAPTIPAAPAFDLAAVSSSG
jgi:hypothetical protein